MLGLGQFSRTWPKRTVGFRSFVTKQHEDKKVSKSKELRKAALDVHKQLLFQVNKWPVVHGLEDRSLKLTLVPRVEQATQIVSETQDQTQILALGKQAQKDLQGALDLLTNKAFTKVSFSFFLLFLFFFSFSLSLCFLFFLPFKNLFFSFFDLLSVPLLILFFFFQYKLETYIVR